MAKLEIRSFGDLQLRLDGASLAEFSSEKGKALLCYLAVTGQPHSRAALAGLLWPESSEENARASLRRTLTGIRQMTPDCLNTTRQTVAVNAEAPIWVDVIRFEELLVAATTIGPLQEAGALYRGDFLEQFYLPDAPAFDRWVLGQRAKRRWKHCIPWPSILQRRGNMTRPYPMRDRCWTSNPGARTGTGS
jgi:DNA-binding SARP family transcriptional activator